jgi:hypothetical protein
MWLTCTKSLCAAFLLALPLLLTHSAANAQIYRWVDENGVTHFSEDKPTNTKDQAKAEDISDRLKGVGNMITFVDPGPIDYFKPKRRQRAANVDIRIENIGYSMTKAQRRHIDEQVRGLYKAYVRWFDWSVEPTHPVTLKIFGSYALFEQYQIENRGRFNTNRSHNSPYHREVLMLATQFADTTLQTLLHETSHAVMDMQVRGSSKWLNEGIAGMFEGLIFERGEIKMLYAGAWSERMNLKLKEGSLASLESYLDIPNQQWGAESSRVESTYYMVAWSLMRYMITTEQGMRALALTLQQQRFYQEQPGELVKTLSDAYPGGIQKLETDWRRWVAEIG